MTKADATLALISIALALVIVLIARLPRSIVVLVSASVVGALAGVLSLLALGVSIVACDHFRASVVDTCSGTYVGGHRLPQFMQRGDAWLIGTAALIGVVLVDAVVLGGMWAWTIRKARCVHATDADRRD